MFRVPTRPLIGWLALALGLGLSACGGHEATDVAQQPEALSAPVIQVQVENRQRLIPVQGLVQPLKRSALMGRSSGPVEAIHVRAGDMVQEGQLLLEIEEEMNRGMLDQARGALAQAEAARTLAEQNYQRFQRLFEREACSQLELDMARMQYEQAEGAVTQAQGAVATASSVSSESEIRAPWDGVVVDRLVEVGDLAAPGRPLLMLESTSGSRLWITVRESDARWLSEGLQIECALDARPELGRITGSVAEIVPGADPATHTRMARIDLPLADLASGLSGRAWIPAEHAEELWIPKDAVYSSGGMHLVSLVDEEGRIRNRAVRTGRSQGSQIEILSGLPESASLVSPLPRPLPEGAPMKESRK